MSRSRSRPDLVRKVLERMRADGALPTLQRVFRQLDEPLKLGYSSAGLVLACGDGVEGLKPGDRAASNGPHASLVLVPRHLTALVPPSVSDENAAFTVLAAIALQGTRLARLGLGDVAYVIGLGLIGQITVALLKLAGVRVLGTDLDPDRCTLARRMGAEAASTGLKAKEVMASTRGLGADAVLVAASSPSNEPITLAAEAVRAKGRIVAVGAVGLDLPRRPLYFKEAELVVSCSYGPGRYDPEYEERGHDYPAPHVRWTEQRNLQAVLELMASGALDLTPLVSHRFPIERADEAYRLIESADEPYLGIVMTYPGEAAPRVTLSAAPPASGKVGIGCLGAGSFARSVLLPLLAREPSLERVVLCSASGLSAAFVGERHGFHAVTADEEQVFADPSLKAVFILTRHDQHARQVVRAIDAGLHVFVEKPLALSVEELAAVEAALRDTARTPILLTGFNRRFAPFALALKEHFRGLAGPRTIAIRFNAGELPPEHWTQDPKTGGGRIVGEACHAIDLATFLAGAPPARVFAESVGGTAAPRISDDQCFLTLRHADGSVSSIAYLAGGDPAFPKERIEVLGGGRMGVIDDWVELTLAANGRSRRRRGARDKGHAAELAAFARAVAGAEPPPIPWEEQRLVSLAAILAVRSLRDGVPLPVE